VLKSGPKPGSASRNERPLTCDSNNEIINNFNTKINEVDSEA